MKRLIIVSVPIAVSLLALWQYFDHGKLETRVLSDVGPQIHRPLTQSENKIPADSHDQVTQQTTAPESARKKVCDDVKRCERDILEQSPRLGKFYAMKYKVIPSSRDQADMDDLLGDSQMIEASFRSLNETKELTELATETRRTMEIDFLIEAMGRKSNPIRLDVAYQVRDFILGDIPSEVTDVNARKIMGVEKIELYAALRKNFPKLALNALNESKNTKLEKLLAYAEQRYLNK